MTDRWEPERSAGRRALVASFAALAVVAVAILTGCSASDGSPVVTRSDLTDVTTAPPATPTAPATAAAAVALPEAPHSGDRPVTDGCRGGGDMLDWDGDGWGDCVQTAAPPTVGVAP